VTYRETFDADLEDPRRQDVVLQQRSVIGPWVALGLGIVLVGFLAYLIYSNVIVSVPPSASLERSLRVVTEPTPTTIALRARRPSPHQPEPGSAAITVVPQSRAINALLGGQGPALPPEHLVESTTQN
jgi:hypothetical protein